MKPTLLFAFIIPLLFGCEGAIQSTRHAQDSPSLVTMTSSQTNISSTTKVTATNTSSPSTSRPSTTPSKEVLPAALWPDLPTNSEQRVMRRLTRAELDLHLDRLVGEDTDLVGDFPPEEVVLGFENNAQALTFPPPMAEAALVLAENLAPLLVQQTMDATPCASTQLDQACATSILQEMGAKAWRRPLQKEELETFTKLFQHTRAANSSPKEALEVALAGLLLAPDLYYRIEFSPTSLSSMEIASRLSFLFLRSGPDQELWQLAKEDQLLQRDVVLQQARRLFRTSEARLMLEDFHHQWWHLDRLNSINKDPEFYPKWHNDMPQKMRQEMALLLEHLLQKPGATYRSLLTTRTTFADQDIADLYGVTQKGQTFAQLELDDSRQGLLTRGGILAADGFNQTSPVMRGYFVRENLLCDLVPAPPDNVDNNFPTPEGGTTTRERVAAKTEQGSCAGCHALMNPIGYGFEGFDSTGRARTKEFGVPIDDTGDVLLSDVGAFKGTAQLAQALASSDLVRTCVARQWFRYAKGRQESKEDASTLLALEEALRQSNGSYEALILAWVDSEAFWSP